MNSLGIKAIIFDFDGVIADTESIHLDAWNAALQDVGYELKDLSPKILFTGRKPIEIATDIIKTLNLNLSADKLFKLKSKHFQKTVYKKIKPRDNLEIILRYQKKQGYKIAIGSSGERIYIRNILKKFNLLNYFYCIVSGEEVVKGKPNPETYKIVAKRLRLLPSECIVIEDSKTGIESAKRAGCFCIALSTPYSSIKDLSYADKNIKSLIELTDFC